MRIAIVVPRYGRDVGGGAETLARDYATRLAGRMDVTVLTTCALDYRTWQDHYPPGEHVEDGVRLVRFPVPIPRNGRAFDKLSATVFVGSSPEPGLEQRWMDAQGPNAPQLVAHLSAEGGRYDAVLFIPYLYATTVRGLPAVADRALLVSAFHDEPPLRLSIFDDIVLAAQTLVFSTPEEQELARRRFGVDPARCHLVGAGIDPPPAGDVQRFRSRFGVDRPYAICLGRIDPSKGSDTLIANHRAYRKRRADGLDLVMVGPAVYEPPREAWLHTPGYVSEEQKHDAISGAVALVCPSPYESLSLVLLEAWSHGIPTIVTSDSPVLLGQTRRAGGGIWYRDTAEYAACLDLLSGRPPLAQALGRAGWRFTQRLGWPAVIGGLEAAIRHAAGLDSVAAVAAAGRTSEPRNGRTEVVDEARREQGEQGPLQVACLPNDVDVVVTALRSLAPASQVYVFTDGPGGTMPPGVVVVVRSDSSDVANRLAAMDIVVDDDCRPGFGEVAKQAGSLVTGSDAQDLGAAIRAARLSQAG